MRKILASLLALMMLTVSAAALAAAPAAGSLSVTYESVRGNASFTVESYPEIWITPIFDQHIIAGNEKYPPHFLRFPLPEGTAALEFETDSVALIDHENLLVYSYYAYDRASFEVFLEKAEPDYTIADGTDGVAMYIRPDVRRAYGMIDIKPDFGNTSKLQIIIDDFTRDITEDTLRALIEAEAERIQATMQLEKLDAYWSTDVFSTIDLRGESELGVTVDASGLAVTKVEENKLVYMKKIDDRNVEKTEIAIDGYSYVDSREESEVATHKMADGTEWRVYTSEVTGYAHLTLLEEGKYGPVYLTVKIDGTPDTFIDKLEAAYGRTTISE